MALLTASTTAHAQPISLRSLLSELTDRDAVARFHDPAYQCLQASSYNRESVQRDQPGWFADSDGTGFIRQETINGRAEWALMEHTGPGATHNRPTAAGEGEKPIMALVEGEAGEKVIRPQQFGGDTDLTSSRRGGWNGSASP